LNNNKLTALPGTIEQLTKLEYLCVKLNVGGLNKTKQTDPGQMISLMKANQVLTGTH
jgi:hypothetical protein